MSEISTLDLHNPELRPSLRSDLASLQIGSERIIWSPEATAPAYLDPIAALISSVFDGSATRSELADDVAAALAVDRTVAAAHVERTIELLADADAVRLPSPLEAEVRVSRFSLPPPNW